MAAATVLGVLSCAPLGVCMAADDTDTNAAGVGTLQEVVVTSTRREENLSNVPISVTAMTQE